MYADVPFECENHKIENHKTLTHHGLAEKKLLLNAGTIIVLSFLTC